jgi:hypothetical protein
MATYRFFILLGLTATLALPSAAAMAQVGGGPVRQDSRPVSEGSSNVGAGSGPVHDSGGSVREGNAGRLSGNSVRGSVTADVLSGPVSDISAGPVTSRQPVSGGGTVTDSSAGAVTKDIDSPIREGIAEPVQGLGRLQQQLRAIEPLPREETGEQETAGQADIEAVEPTPAPPEAAAVPQSDETAEPDGGEADSGQVEEAAPTPEAEP